MVVHHVVDTTSGRVRGSSGAGVLAFRDIPFAADPVGLLRFAPAAPHPGWSGVREATRPGPGAPQEPSRLNGVMGDPGGTHSEAGCLTLNVWTPAVDGRLPVLFWLHGGGWMSGSASWAWYDGARLAAEQNIVVVTANYRLGAFGFAQLTELPGFEDGFGPGNFGSSDQEAALRWVAANIAAFGGDPAAITAAGQSAGAH